MKFDYFDALEALAARTFSGAYDVDDNVLEIMRRLSSDFITPIDRVDIARIVLSLRRCAWVLSESTGGKNQAVDRLCAAVEEYVRALRQVGKRGTKISAKLYIDSSRSARAEVKNANEHRRVEVLCECCELLICTVMNNI